jgi:hypothetical protein
MPNNWGEEGPRPKITDRFARQDRLIATKRCDLARNDRITHRPAPPFGVIRAPRYQLNPRNAQRQRATGTVR